eukprot:467884-Pleurochrysis_carterae.AAC.1
MHARARAHDCRDCHSVITAPPPSIRRYAGEWLQQHAGAPQSQIRALDAAQARERRRTQTHHVRRTVSFGLIGRSGVGVGVRRRAWGVSVLVCPGPVRLVWRAAHSIDARAALSHLDREVLSHAETRGSRLGVRSFQWSSVCIPHASCSIRLVLSSTYRIFVITGPTLPSPVPFCSCACVQGRANLRARSPTRVETAPALFIRFLALPPPTRPCGSAVARVPPARGLEEARTTSRTLLAMLVRSLHQPPAPPARPPSLTRVSASFKLCPRPRPPA